MKLATLILMLILMGCATIEPPVPPTHHSPTDDEITEQLSRELIAKSGCSITMTLDAPGMRVSVNNRVENGVFAMARWMAVKCEDGSAYMMLLEP